MANLKTAHQELFRRTPDEAFATLSALHDHCRHEQMTASDIWERPDKLVITHDLTIAVGDHPDHRLNDWSFSQLCRMAGVSRDTINRLSAKTASKALTETLPRSDKPLQLLTSGNRVRSIHGVAYTRLWNAELLDLVRDAASDFTAPQAAATGGTGLYCGEQDLFAFLIDPTGWVEIEGEAFARDSSSGIAKWDGGTLGIQTFWWQAICANHIVWDAVEVVEFSRKHTAHVRDGLSEIQHIVAKLVSKRDAAKDGFAQVLRRAMTERLGDDADESLKVLSREGIPRELAKKALELAVQQGRLTIFAVVDALTGLTQSLVYIGDRAELDAKIGGLLALAV